MGKKRGWIDYRLVYKIEGKYGSLAKCPEEDEDLKELRKKLRVETEDERMTYKLGEWRKYLKRKE